MSESETFGERLQRLRLAKRFTVKELASRIGVTHPIIGRAELNEHHVRAWRIPMLARALGVTTDYLLTGREAPGLAALHQAIRSRAPHERLLAMVDRHE